MSISILALRLNSEDEHVSGQDIYQERRNSVQQVRAAPPVSRNTHESRHRDSESFR